MADDGVLGTIGDVAGDVLEVMGEGFKKIGKTAVSQVTGKPQDQGTAAAANFKAMAKSDQDFSKQGEAEVRARIAQIYAEYAARRAKEQKQEQLVQNREEEQGKLQVGEIKKQEINPSIAKTRAEIKNYGAE